MGLDQILANLPAVLIPIALVVYYTNQNNIRWMQERKEIVTALAEERREWLEWQKSTIERLFAQQETRFAVQERIAILLEGIKNELHATKGEIQKLMNRYQFIAPKRSFPPDSRPHGGNRGIDEAGNE